MIYAFRACCKHYATIVVQISFCSCYLRNASMGHENNLDNIQLFLGTAEMGIREHELMRLSRHELR